MTKPRYRIEFGLYNGIIYYTPVDIFGRLLRNNWFYYYIEENICKNDNGRRVKI